MTEKLIRKIDFQTLLGANKFLVTEPNGKRSMEFEAIVDFFNHVFSMLKNSRLLVDGAEPYIRGSSLAQVMSHRPRPYDDPRLFTDPFRVSPYDGLYKECKTQDACQYLYNKVAIASTFYQPNIDVYYPVRTPEDARAAASLIMGDIDATNAGIVRGVHEHKWTIKYFMEQIPNGIVRLNVSLYGGYPQHESFNLIFKPLELRGVDLRKEISARQSSLVGTLRQTNDKDWLVLVDDDNIQRFNRRDELTFLKVIHELGTLQSLEFLARTTRFNARNPLGYQTLSDDTMFDIYSVFHNAPPIENVSLFSVARAASEMFWAFMFQPMLVIHVISQLPRRFFPHLSRKLTQPDLKLLREFWSEILPITENGRTFFIDHMIRALYGLNDAENIASTKIGQRMHDTFVATLGDMRGNRFEESWQSNIRIDDLELFGYLLFAFLPIDIDEVLKLVPADMEAAQKRLPIGHDSNSSSTVIVSPTRYELEQRYSRKLRF